MSRVPNWVARASLVKDCGNDVIPRPRANVESGIGNVVDRFDGATFNDNVFTVNLTGVASAQTIVVKLTNVRIGTTTGNVFIPMSILVGDTNGNRIVNASDVSQTKARIGHRVDSSNFRSDVNANGAINAGEVANVKSNIGNALP